jgi:hypothetical protein
MPIGNCGNRKSAVTGSCRRSAPQVFDVDTPPEDPSRNPTSPACPAQNRGSSGNLSSLPGKRSRCHRAARRIKFEGDRLQVRLDRGRIVIRTRYWHRLDREIQRSHFSWNCGRFKYGQRCVTANSPSRRQARPIFQRFMPTLRRATAAASLITSLICCFSAASTWSERACSLASKLHRY